MINLTDETFDAEVLQATTPVLVSFFATWCGPCKVVAPRILTFEKTYGDRIKFYRLDVDDCPARAQEIGINAMPTFIIFKNGDKVAEVLGANEKAVEAAIKSLA